MRSIAITVSINKSIFHQGTNVTSIYLYKALADAGFSPIFLNNSTQPWFDHIPRGDFKVTTISDAAEKYDFVLELQWHLTPAQRSTLASKTVVFMHYPPLMHDIECTTYPHYSLAELVREHPNDPVDWNTADYIWTWDCYTAADIKYLQLITSRPVFTIPIVWNSLPLEGTAVPDWSGTDTPMIHICEGNRNNSGNALIPLTIARALRDSDTTWNTVPVFVHDSGSLVTSQFFKDNILNNLRLTEYGFTFIERKNITSLVDHKSVVLMHQRFRPFRAALFDCLWLGIPVVHNFQAYDYGFKYVDNSVSSAIDAFARLRPPTTEQLQEQREWLTCTFSGPVINAKIQDVFTQMQTTVVPQSLQQQTRDKYLHIWFEDFWADFQPSYNFFTLLLDSESRGRKWKLDAERPDVVFFGPYTQRHRRFKRRSEGGPLKIMFTGENTRPSPEADINLGFDYTSDPNYIRLPLWILEINWFGADAARVVNPKPFPLERLTEVYPDELAGRDTFCGFVVSNPMNPIRNEAFKQLSTYKHVASGGALFNNIGRKLEGGPGGGGGELTKLEFFKKCKFALVFENAANPGYVTEKILHAKAAGCIPIYWGDPDVTREFNPSAFINARDAMAAGGWPALIAAIKEVDENPRKWLEMYNSSLFYPSTIASVRERMIQLASLVWGTTTTTVTLDQAVSTSIASATKSVYMIQPPVEVVPRVWLGCAQIASNREWLTSNRITHVVNCIAGEGFKTVDGVKSLEFPAEDTHTYRIIDLHYADVKKFIDDALDVGGSVLVHCRAGINRSGALVVAYAAEREDCQPAAIVERIGKVRPYILLNPSFRKQIEDMRAAPAPVVQAVVSATMSSSGRSVSRRILMGATANFAGRAALLLKCLTKIEPKTPVHLYQIDDFPAELCNTLMREHPHLQICKFAPITIEGFADYMAPEHYAWKLRLIADEIAACEERTQLLYLDTGMIPMKKDLSGPWATIETFGALFVDDSTQKNIKWCHPEFCKNMNVTSSELDGNQLWAGVLGIDTASPHVKVFKKARAASENPNIIKGDKWKPYNDVCAGHRHDQSILSILSQRAGATRQNIASIYSHISYEDARLTDVEFYVHRGNIIQYVPFTAAVNQAHIIITSDVALKKFKGAAGEGLKNIYGFSDTTALTPEKRLGFLRNNFGWKRATVDRTWKHYCLWRKLAQSEHCTKFLIVEDDCVPHAGWKDALAMLPPCDVLMLSGSQRAGAYVISMTAIQKLLEYVGRFGLCKVVDALIRDCELTIVENPLFDVMDWTDDGEAYVTEGCKQRPPVCAPVKWDAVNTDTAPIVEMAETTVFFTGAREAVLEWEYDWFCELMPWLSTATWMVPTEDAIRATDHAVFIVAGYMPETWRWVKFASDVGKQFTLLHTSDEWERDALDVYALPGCKHVVRNYWRPGLPGNVLTIPLGYKKGMFGSERVSTAMQPYLWTFAGDPNKSGRAAVLSTLTEAGPYKMHCTAGWKAANCLTVDEYRAFLQSGTFTPCMTGNWNVDCFRIWEALECGSVPIVFSPTKNQPYNYFNGLLGDGHPLIVVNAWEDAASIMMNLRDAALQNYKQRLFTWWNNYKGELKGKLAHY